MVPPPTTPEPDVKTVPSNGTSKVRLRVGNSEVDVNPPVVFSEDPFTLLFQVPVFRSLLLDRKSL